MYGSVAVETALIVVGCALVAGVIAVGLRVSRALRADEARFAVALTRGFGELARRRGLEVERLADYAHPVVGAVAVPPRLRGELDGFGVLVAIEGERGGRIVDESMVVRVSARAHAPDWPTLPDACHSRSSLPSAARAALGSLCALSGRVQLGPRELVIEPPARAIVSAWIGQSRNVVSDPDRLESWLDAALAFARALSEPLRP